MALFKSKAETLIQLEGNLINAVVLPQVSFKVFEWENGKNLILDKIINKNWGNGTLVVRSSAIAEDSCEESLAGHFTSVINISGRSRLENAIKKVIKSYYDLNKNNIVLVQPYLKDVFISGVAFSKNPSNGANYTIINYDDTSGSTSSVTDGGSNKLKTFYFYNKNLSKRNTKFNSVLKLLEELKQKFASDNIDIEFAIDNSGKLYLFQVRPLVLTDEFKFTSDNLVLTALKKVSKKFLQLSSPHPFLFGNKSIFGLMPDWNPAEIIGVRPNNLALSLYKELITDNIWAYQRDNYGYKNLRSFPLLINFSGIPYIDVRVSFNSFIPAKINNQLATKLVDYYIDRLINFPDLHDKVEFEITFSCYTFDIDQRLKTLLEYGFTKSEVDDLSCQLKKLTNNIIHSKKGLWITDRKKIEILRERREKILSSNLDDLSKIYWLIEDCKRYGTLPFAGLARAGFMAMQILQSLVKENILSANDFSTFLYSVHTVNSELISDLNSLDFPSFLKKYGHLRPGTYDIMQPRYDEKPDRYFILNQQKNLKSEKKEAFRLSEKQYSQIKQLLIKHEINTDVDELFQFIRGAIEGREYSKFIFSRNLSDTLQLINKYGEEELKISKEDLSHLEIKGLLNLYSNIIPSRDLIINQIQFSKLNYDITKKISLPSLIVNEEDIWSFEISSSEPNFTTSKIVEGETVIDLEKNLHNLKGKILFIPSADPGFDWIFPHEIAGFITMYGGANSHMAIRAAELGIPAVIGAGETLYNRWRRARNLEINCVNKKVSILS